MTVLYWKDSPIGMVALMLMCGGDGMADVIGRKFGKRKLPWAPEKSWMGSTAMFFGGWILSLGILWVFVAANVFAGPMSIYIPALTLIAIAGTIVESLPLKDIDNITITLSAVILGHLWL
jgi:phytol kinase